MTTPQDATPVPATEAPPKLSFFTLDPRKVGRKRLLRTLFFALLIVSFSVAPLWRLGWYYPVYSAKCFFPLTDSHGRWRAAWHWVDGKEIRLYAGPGVSSSQMDATAAGVRAMVDDIKLDFTVRVLPMPDEVRAAYAASLITRKASGTKPERQVISFTRLEKRLIELRAGDPHADMLVVDQNLADAEWAFGMASFTSGVGVFVADQSSFHLGKHETGHLLGYLFHDNLPLFILGYPWEGSPVTRDSLMMMYGKSDELSPRCRDALTAFWRGLETRSGKRFLRE